MVKNYKMIRKTTLLLFLFLSSLQITFAQSAVVPSTGPTCSGQRKPLGVWYGYERSQMRYAGSELSIPAGSFITAVSFYYITHNNTGTCGAGPLLQINDFDYKVYVREVASPTIPQSTYPTALNGMAPSGNGTMLCTTWNILPLNATTCTIGTYTSGQWITLPLSSPVFYTGAVLEVLVETNYGLSGDPNGWFPEGSENAIYFDRHMITYLILG